MKVWTKDVTRVYRQKNLPKTCMKPGLTLIKPGLTITNQVLPTFDTFPKPTGLSALELTKLNKTGIFDRFMFGLSQVLVLWIQ
jgi:hypothetical protein